MEFTVLHMDEPVAYVWVSEDHKQVKIDKLIPDCFKQPFCGDRLDIFRIYQFLKSRCYEDGRGDLKEILAQAEMTSNNPWEWVKHSHGVTYEDFWWVRFPGEQLTWENVKVR